MIRRKPKYNDMWLIHISRDGIKTKFQAEELSSNSQVSMMIGMPIQDTGSTYITSSDIHFQLDDIIIEGETKKRITAIPNIKPHKTDNNSRRGVHRKDKVLVTT